MRPIPQSDGHDAHTRNPFETLGLSVEAQLRPLSGLQAQYTLRQLVHLHEEVGPNDPPTLQPIIGSARPSPPPVQATPTQRLLHAALGHPPSRSAMPQHRPSSQARGPEADAPSG